MHVMRLCIFLFLFFLPPLLNFQKGLKWLKSGFGISSKGFQHLKDPQTFTWPFLLILFLFFPFRGQKGKCFRPDYICHCIAVMVNLSVFTPISIIEQYQYDILVLPSLRMTSLCYFYSLLQLFDFASWVLRLTKPKIDIKVTSLPEKGFKSSGHGLSWNLLWSTVALFYFFHFMIIQSFTIPFQNT